MKLFSIFMLFYELFRKENSKKILKKKTREGQLSVLQHITQYFSRHSRLTSSQSRTRAEVATAVKRVMDSYWDSPLTGAGEDTGTGPISHGRVIIGG